MNVRLSDSHSILLQNDIGNAKNTECSKHTGLIYLSGNAFNAHTIRHNNIYMQSILQAWDIIRNVDAIYVAAGIYILRTITEC